MTIVEILKQRALEYANMTTINHKTMAKAVTMHYYRVEGKFEEINHTYKHDKTGRSEGCGCDYCKILGYYVRARLRLHRLKKPLYNDHIVNPYRTVDELIEAINQQEKLCMRIRRKLVELGETMDVPNAIKRKAKYNE